MCVCVCVCVCAHAHTCVSCLLLASIENLLVIRKLVCSTSVPGIRLTILL